MSDQLLHNPDAFQEDTAVALQLCAQELAYLGYQLKCLGNADAATPMGAIEAFGLVMKEGMESISAAISDLADAIRNP